MAAFRQSATSPSCPAKTGRRAKKREKKKKRSCDALRNKRIAKNTHYLLATVEQARALPDPAGAPSKRGKTGGKMQ